MFGIYGKCVDVRNASPFNLTPVQIYTCNGTVAQDWVPLNGELINPNSGRCLDDPASRAPIADDTAAGKRLGIKSTPTLFINGRAVEGALDRSRYEYVIALERRS